MTSPTVNDMMAAYAEDAVDFARSKFGIALDYTNESVERVEFIAEQLMQAARPKGLLGKLLHKAPSDEEIQAVCKMLGGYIGEVFRRAKGGEWGINQEFQALGVQQGENWIFPPAKVHKRLTNGSEDNLWSYFRIVLEEPWQTRDA